MKDEYFFTLDGLSVGYGKKAVVSDINVRLPRGTVLSLVGPNGAGKSTILNTITRRLSALAGVVCVDGGDIRKMRGRDVAQRLAAVTTERIRPELTTVYEIAASGRYPYTNAFGTLTPNDKKAVWDALSRVGVDDIVDCDFLSLSDGQRQRVMLARAICQEPDVIVLDEPTSYLDIKHKIELLEILRSMARSGVTVVMSMHEIDLASKVSDILMLIKDGRVAGLGAPGDVADADSVRELYGIGCGSYDDVFGSVELPRADGEPLLFVVGGGGCGIPFYRRAQSLSVPCAAGIIAENDVDIIPARALCVEVITAPVFEIFTEREAAAAHAVIDRCRAVADCGAVYGVVNRENARLLDYARERGKRIITSPDETAEACGI